MKKLHELRHRLAEALREVAFRLDKQQIMLLRDVEDKIDASIHAHFAQHAAHEAQQDAQRAYSAYCAQNQAGERGFWVPKSGSGSPN